MRITYFISGILLTALISCGGYRSKYEDLNNKYQEMEKEYSGLKQEERLVKGEYTATIETLNSIEDTLRSINERDAKIRQLTRQTETGNLKQRESILNQINALMAANEQSRREARLLQQKINGLKIENQQLKKMVDQANAKLEQVEGELTESKAMIEQLNSTLNKLEGQLLEKSGELAGAYENLKNEKDQLEKTNSQLQSTVSDLKKRESFIDDCGRAYVVCGTRSALRKNDIIQDLGKGLTKNYKENVKKLNSTINYFEKDEILCDDGNIKEILPARPTDSYRLDGGKLKILNNKTFWATDKVVVMVKD